jgi:hypothetical protein
LAGTLQVSKLIKRASGTNLEKSIRETLLIELVVLLNWLYILWGIPDESVPLLIIEARRGGYYHRSRKTVNQVSNMFVTAPPRRLALLGNKFIVAYQDEARPIEVLNASIGGETASLLDSMLCGLIYRSLR